MTAVRVLAFLGCILVWVPAALLWCLFAPLFAFGCAICDVLNLDTAVGDELHEWKFFNVRVTWKRERG